MEPRENPSYLPRPIVTASLIIGSRKVGVERGLASNKLILLLRDRACLAGAARGIDLLDPVVPSHQLLKEPRPMSESTAQPPTNQPWA